MEGDGFEPLIAGRETVKPLVGDGTACSKTGADLLGNRKFESISLQQTVCLSPAAAFKGREPGFPRGFGQLAWRPGQQRLAG